MLQFIVTLQSLLATRMDRNDKGATAVEYGLMVALIAGAIIGTVTLLGTSLNGLFNTVQGLIAAA